MSAEWKKIILSGSEAELNEVSASNGIQLNTFLGVDSGVITVDPAGYKALVLDSDGNVLQISSSDIGAEGSSLNSFVTMSVNGTATVSSSTTTVSDTLLINSSVGNPLTVTGNAGSDTITITVATQSGEQVQDYAAAMFTGGNQNFTQYSSNHQNITFNYDDAGNGTFSLTGSATTSFATTTGQTGISIDEPVGGTYSFSPSGVQSNNSVIFVNITASNYTEPNDLSDQDSLNNRYGDGNISQTTNLQFYPPSSQFYQTSPINTGEYVSASALHITNSTYVGNDLTMSGDFIFQGFAFDDAQVLVHSGSNIFGSGSMPAALTSVHQFTGSLLLSKSDITLQQSNSFNGDGSGLTNLTTSSIVSLGLLSGSSQIANDISGAFHFLHPTLRTASLTNGTVSAITASGLTVTDGFSGLASGKQIYSTVSASDSAFTVFVASEYIVSASANDTSGLDIVTTGNIGGTGPISQTIALNISKSVEESLAGADLIMVADQSSGFATVGATINSLAFMTGSSAGTTTEISAGNGIQVINPTGYSGETVVNTTVNVVLSGSATTYGIGEIGGYTDSNLILNDDDLQLNPKINITSIQADTASFSELKVTPGDIALLNTEEVTIHDNFILLNSNIAESIEFGNNEDAGFSINRGSENDANLFWDEASKRWSINLANLQSGSSEDASTGYSTTTATPDSHLVTSTFSNSGPSTPPVYGGNTNGEGSIHIDKSSGAQEVWIWA